jgi:hypothetical protein
MMMMARRVAGRVTRSDDFVACDVGNHAFA